ncbi:hypothetical protein HPB47_005234, partial [Ixodes persulcatus]
MRDAPAVTYRTEDIQSNVVLLAYFAHLLGVQCEEAFGKSVFQGLSFTPELQLYHVNRLLQVYEQSKQYHLMVALPQLKKSLFKPKKWFGELVPGLQAMEHTNVSWFTCLNTAMNIAPNLGDQDILRVVDEFLENVLHTYNKLFRIPKLVRNIFSSLSNLEAKVSKSTCISALFLKNFSECCTSLSSGQVTESWHLFVSQLSYWISQNKETKDSKDFYKILLVTEIFITFLHHIQAANPTMPAIHVTKVTELMATTSKLAAEMLDFSIENKSVDSSYCSLVMFHAWGELHMLLCSYRRVYGESVAWPTLPAPLEQTHLSYLHPALTPAKLEALQPLLDKGKNKRALYALNSLNPVGNVGIIFDGKWKTRGQNLNIAVGCILELFSGLVLDHVVFSRHCRGCHGAPDPDDDGYGDWLLNHKCLRNIDCKAGRMEAE